MFTRKELQDIREKAKDIANQSGMAHNWMRALYELADTADKLDAMIARTKVTENK